MAKSKENTLALVGGWAFIIGVVIALLMGVFRSLVANPNVSAILVGILIIMGIVVGFLNVTGDETKDFLLATVSLVIVSGFGSTVLKATPLIGPALETTLSMLMVFIIPAVIVVALKAVFAIAKDA
jgi:ATP synthase protein I